MTVIPSLRSLRQVDHKFEVSLGYIARPCLKKQKQKSRVRVPLQSLTGYGISIWSVYSVSLFILCEHWAVWDSLSTLPSLSFTKTKAGAAGRRGRA
jgi:hypothetical protein